MEHHKLNGTLKHDPKRFANRTETPNPSAPLGYPPKEFSDLLKEIWNEVRSQALPNTLANSDRQMVEILCSLIEKSRDKIISVAERGQLISILCHMGMSPDSRTRIQSVVKRKIQDTSPFATFSSPRTGTDG